jgi:hypothetical protein
MVEIYTVCPVCEKEIDGKAYYDSLCADLYHADCWIKRNVCETCNGKGNVYYEATYTRDGWPHRPAHWGNCADCSGRGYR